MGPTFPSTRLVGGLLGTLFLVELVVLGVAPAARDTWLLENLFVFLGLGVLVGTWRSFRLSRVSYLLLFLFLCVHEVGAHYTYSLVPYDDWSQSLLGFSLDEALGWERNHFDRAVHFLYGLLLAYPVREFYLRVVSVRGAWGYLLPLSFTLSTSAAYELIEWAAAVLFGGDTGQAFLGMQGDVWDAQKDVALAALGATLAMGITIGINSVLQRDFAAEWVESLRVKKAEPLGEDAIVRMLEENKDSDS